MARRRGRGRRWEYVKLPGNTGAGGGGAVIRARSTAASAAISFTTSDVGRRATLPTTPVSLDISASIGDGYFGGTRGRLACRNSHEEVSPSLHCLSLANFVIKG